MQYNKQCSVDFACIPCPAGTKNTNTTTITQVTRQASGNNNQISDIKNDSSTDGYISLKQILSLHMQLAHPYPILDLGVVCVHSMGMVVPGYVKRRLSMHFCIVGQL